MRFRGVVYRAHNPEWAWKPLSGEGARRHGGRFNRRGVPALYTSLSPLTAIREAQPLGRRMQPLTLCACDVELEPVFDSRDGAVRAALQVDDHELDCRSWAAQMLDGSVPASQALAERLVAASYVGMLVRSYAVGAGSKDINLVLWEWGSQRPRRVVLIDDERRLSTGTR